jgi:hypothetical protein
VQRSFHLLKDEKASYLRARKRIQAINSITIASKLKLDLICLNSLISYLLTKNSKILTLVNSSIRQKKTKIIQISNQDLAQVHTQVTLNQAVVIKAHQRIHLGDKASTMITTSNFHINSGLIMVFLQQQ